ncbi:GNAT family N-acetyltransferase [Hymenobacter latericus]|uniref:GNAT family N-acetyltransferase n=1 Tax=Hymenobacter sp. YIM 151858-1 TaxID=2987688 RepID=UPI0022274FAC|nr:GNAT family protein [Hymenobacter sp. YIM 151858-1]UYZ59046.1 GNAT family N-acetyltransferase [Hymenobacter sp. YIM 151858-1]
MPASGPYPPAQLRTARLVLRPFTIADAPALAELIATERPRLRRNFPRTAGAIQDEATAGVYITLRETDWHLRTAFQYGLWLPGGAGRSPQCVGYISLRDMHWTPFDVPKAELGYWLAATHEGQGLMREALPAVLQAVFGAVGLEKLFARVLPENVRSSQLLLHLGFRHSGVLRREFRCGDDGTLHDIDYYDLLRAEWHARSAETA